MSEIDKIFSGSVSKIYEKYLVPLLFEPYAADLVERLRSRSLSRVLEVAAGTGVVTRALATALSADVSIVATDLNQAMLDQAALVGTTPAVLPPTAWRPSAVHLTFDQLEQGSQLHYLEHL